MFSDAAAHLAIRQGLFWLHRKFTQLAKKEVIDTLSFKFYEFYARFLIFLFFFHEDKNNNKQVELLEL